MTKILKLTQELIACASVTPTDAGCQAILIQRLEELGFKITPLPFGLVKNFWARLGDSKPLMVFAGHTDVVPVGDANAWSNPPFEAVIKENYLYGRGAADMKGSLAAMVIACENFLTKNLGFSGSIGFLITGDEEGPSIDGTAKVVDYLEQQKIKMDYCLVGEPSSVKQLGDTVKIGRRGSLHLNLTIHGVQGHVAYPHLADNPIHKALSALDELTKSEWDKGSENFPPTTFQISNIHSGTGATNVIPGTLEITANWRFSDATSPEIIKQKLSTILNAHSLNYEANWNLGSAAFLTQSKELISICSQAVQDICSITPEFNTTGGTSDARFIAPTGCEVVELGPINKTIHQVDECVALNDLERLCLIYERILYKLFVRE